MAINFKQLTPNVSATYKTFPDTGLENAHAMDTTLSFQLNSICHTQIGTKTSIPFHREEIMMVKTVWFLQRCISLIEKEIDEINEERRKLYERIDQENN